MNLIDEILKEVNNVVLNVNEKEIGEIVETLNKNNSIFVDGEGRSGFQAKGFAMRLMHIGYKSYVMGETITPALKKDDIFIAISGSGTTKNTLSNASSAKNLGLKIIAVTNKRNSPLGEIADIILEVPGKIKSDGEGGSIQLLSSLFDQAVHIVLDCVCLLISKRENLSNSEALNNHVNIE
ncbi:6-phospho-3-hexuloisomerase [Clostridium sp. AL.422]|uniref:6-phospho-3-hexuloisomerase n=1 Tax=Clostridium TaxID=1485 RepID=UPI00293DF40E|nr:MULTISPECIES: 6-phospho-3-hexuloisomerase [unclassified Clostridium]MDV4150516.1 6-phospho-3-hexuloisomerase [Clostridium sp. AL.422]